MNKRVAYMILALAIVLTVKFPERMINPGKLMQAHAELDNDCASCHQPFWGIPDANCISCHAINDIGVDSIGTIDSSLTFHRFLNKTSCISCHDDHKGRIPLVAVSRFDHDLVNATTLQNCAGCHGKPDDALHLAVVSTCSNCHSTAAWKLTQPFEHRFIQTAKQNDCRSCHQAPKDDLHTDLVQTNCKSCHGTSAWTPSTFKHDTYFVLDKDHNVQCRTCHTTADLKVYTCYGCHEHTEREMVAEHAEEGIYSISDCARCHKDADEDHAKRSIGDKQWNNAEPKGNKEHNKKQHKEEHDEENMP